MGLVNTQNVLFSIKSYTGAMLALFAAFYLALDRPYWAFISAYIASQPYTGAVLSKAVYRICGSFIGLVATIIMVPNFVNEPLLLSFLLSLWISLCLYVSIFDRTPRSYTFYLAGYTVAIMGFPSVNTPNDIFYDAVSRFEEITLGILCATFIHSLFFPRDVSVVFGKNIDMWWQKVKKIMPDVFAKKANQELVSNWQALASEITQLYILSTQLVFDTTNLKNKSAIGALDERMTSFLATLYVIIDRLHAIRNENSIEPKELIRHIKSLLSATGNQPQQNIPFQGEEQTASLPVDMNSKSTWYDILKISLINNLNKLIVLYKECHELRVFLFSDHPKTPSQESLFRSYKKIRPLHLDKQIALLSAIATFLSIMSICLFWIATAWPAGSAAALLAAIACCFFANQIDPVPFILAFMFVLILTIPIAAFYLFAILPRVNGFFMLVLVLTPFYILAGILMSIPSKALIGTAAVLSLANLMLYQNGYSAEFASFMNTSLALIVGMGSAALFNHIFRSLGKEWNITRLLFAIRRDLIKMALSNTPSNITAFNLRTVDRLGLLTLLKMDSTTDRFLLLQGLRSLSLGQDINHLQSVITELPSSIGKLIRDVLDELVRHFRTHKLHRYDTLSTQLLELIDLALGQITAIPQTSTKENALLGLCGLRRNLFPVAAAYNPFT